MWEATRKAVPKEDLTQYVFGCPQSLETSVTLCVQGPTKGWLLEVELKKRPSIAARPL